MDLTPPEELRARRIRRWLIGITLLLLTLAGVAYYFRIPASHAIKDWHARRNVREAFALIAQGKWPEAEEKARDAFQLSPTEPETWRAIGRLLSRKGQNGTALEWWAKVAQAGRLSPDDRRDYAAAALATSDLTIAGAQVDLLLALGGPLTKPIDVLLAAQLNARLMNGPAALEYAQRVLADPRAEPNQILSAALLIIAIVNPESAPYDHAWTQMEELGRDPANPMSLDALVQIAQQKAPVPPSSEDTKPFSDLTVAPAATAKHMPAAELAHALESHPRARPFHKLLALELRTRSEPWRTGEFVTQAIEQFGKGDEESFAAMAAWLNAHGRADAVLQLLPLDRALRQRALFLPYLDTLAALGRWTEMKELLSGDRFPLDPMLQHMYLAVARSQLGESAGVDNEWQRALEAADNPDKLFALGGYAESHGAAEIADEAYNRAIGYAPKMQPAYAARLRLAQQHGRTADAQRIAAEMVKIWPTDVAVSQEEAYLRILLGAPSPEIEKAEKDTQALVTPKSTDWNARKLLGLARLRLGKAAAALQAFSGVRATGSEPPGALAVRAAALAANGWTEGARNDARNLAAAELLPEERALLAPIIVTAEQ